MATLKLTTQSIVAIMRKANIDKAEYRADGHCNKSGYNVQTAQRGWAHGEIQPVARITWSLKRTMEKSTTDVVERKRAEIALGLEKAHRALADAGYLVEPGTDPWRPELAVTLSDRA